MTYESDPTRWTHSPELAPEALQKPLLAAVSEGPSDLQMKMLALKLAAVAAGSATAAGAATAKAAASTAGASAKAAGTLTLGKALASLVIVGAVSAGAVLWQRGSEPQRPSVHAPASKIAPAQPALEQAPANTPHAPMPAQPAPVVTAPSPVDERASAVEGPAPEAETTAPEAEAKRAPRLRSERRPEPARTRKASVADARARSEQAEAKHAREAEAVAKSADVPSEVELLRRARAALASRPRSAFALTEEHREHYPRGVFAQERDALAIEALVRAGDTDRARELARSFVRDYPASPHAHRFRESMGL